MTEGMEVYPLTLRDGQWWLPYGPVADAEMLAALLRTAVQNWSTVAAG